jgi:hypothetical protein
MRKKIFILSIAAGALFQVDHCKASLQQALPACPATVSSSDFTAIINSPNSHHTVNGVNLQVASNPQEILEAQKDVKNGGKGFCNTGYWGCVELRFVGNGPTPNICKYEYVNAGLMGSYTAVVKSVSLKIVSQLDIDAGKKMKQRSEEKDS